MAKQSGSKSSRSGRKAGKERAVRARERGLPQAAPESEAPRAARVRAATPEPRSFGGEDRSSDAPPLAIPKSAGLPTGAKLAIAVAVLLGGVYLLSRYRDSTSAATAEPEPPTSASPVAVTEPEPPTSASPTPPAEPPAAPEAPVEPVVEPSAPVVSPPTKPSASKPVAPKPAVAAPRPVAPVASPTTPATPVVPAAPAAAPPAAPKPVDNPY
jgi:hypothetical protein